MKKLYFLNEDEKNRIINLHENATKKQYLNEVAAPLIYGAIAAGAYIVGHTYDYFANSVGTADTDVFINEVNKGCSQSDVQSYIKREYTNPTEQTKQADMVILNLIKNLKSKAHWITTSEATNIKSELTNVSSIPQFCLILDRYKKKNNEGLLNRIRDQYYYHNSFLDDIQFPIQEILIKQQEINKESGDEEKNKWDDFKCVRDDKRTKPTKAPNIKKIEYTSGDYYFWDDGKYKSYNKGETTNPTKVGKYKCDDKNQILLLKSDETKASEKKVEDGTKVVRSDSWYSINQTYDNQIKQALGKEAGKLTDEDINLIYDKLKQAGKIK